MGKSIDKDLLRQKVIKLIQRSEEELIQLKDMSAPVSPENAIGRISRMDAINNKSVTEAALRNKKQKLSKLKIALSNLDKENFGICVFCKNPIQEARIMYIPESNRCVRCADR